MTEEDRRRIGGMLDELDGYGYEHLSGVCHNGENYLYIYDEHDVICGISDERDNQIVKYVYDENDIVSNVLELKNGIWITNSDSEFIGNKNRMLSGGMFFDKERNCYYINGRYFDPVSKKYMDGDDEFDLYLTENPFYMDSVNITPYSASDSESAAKKWAKRSYRTGSSPFSDTSNSTLEYNGKAIKNVQVIGYGKLLFDVLEIFITVINKMFMQVKSRILGCRWYNEENNFFGCAGRNIGRMYVYG